MMACNNMNSRCRMMRDITEVSFAVEDILLYLDTHPCDGQALSYYKEMSEKRRNLMKEYAKAYGPLTVDDALETCGDTWKWMEQPFPWEKEGACR